MTLKILRACLLATAIAASASAQTNPLWHEQKTKNFLPHMTWPEVEALRERTDMVIIPVASLEQHGYQLPIGTDFYNGLHRALLVAQATDVLVAPVLWPGNSPYHMEFPGTITLPAELIQQVYVEAAKSLIQHGFTRVLILNSHGGNQIISRFIADRINHETAGIAVELEEAAAPFRQGERTSESAQFDRHGGVSETAASLYLTPNLVEIERAVPADLTLPPQLDRMLADVVAGDPTATRVFLAEGLKATSTGKGTSARDMSDTGVWSVRDPKEADVDQGRVATASFVRAAVAFIERWKALRPMAVR